VSRLNEKINALEETVKTAIQVINDLKSQHTTLIEEKNRLIDELNQLKQEKGRSLGHSQITGGTVELGSSDINIELVKNELDQCIEELSLYINEHSK